MDELNRLAMAVNEMAEIIQIMADRLVKLEEQVNELRQGDDRR